jgi:hypothetical protein
MRVDIKTLLERNRQASVWMRRIGLSWQTKEANAAIVEALRDEQAALEELAELRCAASLVVAQFAEIDDERWPTRGMKQAIERLQATVAKTENREG